MNWKNVPSSSVLIVLLFLSQATFVSATYSNVDVSQAKEMIDSNPDLVILDVRTWEEYICGHIEHATLIPVGELEGRLGELDNQKPTLVYCRSGVRSAAASQILVDNGFVEIYNMLGGIEAWIAAGYPVEIEVSGGYGAIQVSINAANEGDTIFVPSGTYYECVVVNKTVNLVGEDSENTVIDGNGTQIVSNIVNSKVNVTRLTIQNGFEGVYVRDNADSCTIADCKILNTICGIFVNSDNNLLNRNTIVNSSESGITIYASCGCSPVLNNVVTENKLLSNGYGVNLRNSLEGLIYHNSFVNNTQQVYTVGSYTEWDNDYPSGGNYWSDYADVDLYSGPYQNITGSDGIGDAPYVIDGQNQDNYPLMEPWSPDTTPPSVCILSPQSKTYVTSSVPLTFILYFNSSWIGYSLDDQANVTVTGNIILTDLSEGTHSLTVYANDTSGCMHASNTIYFTIVFPIPGDLNYDGVVNIRDVAIVARAFGSFPTHPRWNPIADVNQDDRVDIRDVGLVARNFGRTA